ncbi:MAG TPA: hypothetical protein VM008_00320 [Phycisphaerae bacterium]|nr:hypothetical protein [Phycisphaerae bacterium]
MDISGRIRAVLGGVDFRGNEEQVFAVMVRSVLGTLGEKWRVHDTPRHIETYRLEHGRLMAAGMMRVRGKRDSQEMGRLMGRIQQETEEDLGRTDARPGELLWGHWLLTLSEKLGGAANDRAMMKRLWERGVGAEMGTFHRLTSETLLDGFVYDELVAIHAAYNSAKVMGDEGMMERVGRAVRWHVENTQPDNATNEPWGLAAFAALDETGTFAEQQLHDAVMGLRNSPALPNGQVPVAVGLLADAVMTLENW